MKNRTKCGTVSIGGCAVPQGYGGPANAKKACDKLRCVGCDFKVVSFEDKVWHARSEYIFFRHGCNDPQKLAPNLVSKSGEHCADAFPPP